MTVPYAKYEAPTLLVRFILVVPRNRQFRWNIELRDDPAHRSEFGCGDVEERAPEGG